MARLFAVLRQLIDHLGRHSAVSAVTALVLLPLLIKSPLLLGILNSESVGEYAGIDVSRTRGFGAGWPTIDPNIGYTSDALGTHAARLWLSGEVPWWNHLEGVGAPLAGGMQSAALFPPIVLLALPQGQLLFHLLLQIVAGLATFGLLRQLRLGILPSLSGAVAFQFSGVFAWMANAVVNPVAFLPVILWGVECQRSPSAKTRGRGILLIGCGLALSLYAGFPEVAYLNGLLIAAWCFLRFWQSRTEDFTGLFVRIASATIAGLLIAAPILLAFFSYLPLANLGMHENSDGAYAHLAAQYLPALAFPYFFGGIFSRPIEFDFWNNVGGYSGFLLLVCASAGAFSCRDRPLNRLLAIWIVATLALSYGAWWLFEIVQFVPGVQEAALYRYLCASWSLAACVLAARAIDDMIATRDPRSLRLALIATAVATVAALALSATAIGWFPRNAIGLAVTGVQLLICVGFAALLISRRWASPTLLAGLLTLEAVFLFAFPVLAHPRQIVTAEGGIRFLQSSLGLQRFATFGPIAPNYGSYFGIAQVNHNNLPTPKAWTERIKTRLDPGADPILFLTPTSIETFMRHVGGYADIGVRYVVTPAATNLPGLRRSYVDQKLSVWEVPGTRPYFRAPGCAIRAISRDRVVTLCQAASNLTRLELNMPGWSAAVNGMAAPVRQVDEIFQGVIVPAGTAKIDFAFRPPFMSGALAAALAGFALLIALYTVGRQRDEGKKIYAG